jgi:glycosyltransferase involved in cell wall biosynthesis
MKLSVVLITKNEERIISRCLDSVRWADEVVVVDSGSTDKTLEIAKRFNARIFKRTWAGYSAQKNFAISKAKGQWILSLDADEIITDGLKMEILRVIRDTGCGMRNKSGKPGLSSLTPDPESRIVPSGFFIPRLTYFYGHLMRFGNVYPDYQMRLFKRGSGRYEQTEIHERLIVDGGTSHLKRPMLHYSKADIKTHLDTLNSYTELELKRAVKLGYRPTGYSVLIKPFLYFMKHYFWKFGFLNGIYGFIFFKLNAEYIFLKEVKAMEAAGLGKFDLLKTLLKRAR